MSALFEVPLQARAWAEGVSAVAVARWSGRETRALREARRMSVRAFAAHLGVAAASVSNWERRGLRIRLRDETQEILDRDLGLADTQTRARFDAALAGSLVGSADAPTPVFGLALALSDSSGVAEPDHATPGDLSIAGKVEVTPTPPDLGGEESVAEVLGRMHRRGRSVDPDVVRQLRDDVLGVVSRYEELDHADFVSELRSQRAWLEALIEECGRPAQRRDLTGIACAASGVLGYVAVGRGRFALARAYSAEAFQLGEFAERPDLMAWARGLQSFCAYYQQDYTAAAELAFDGLRHAVGGPQVVRLAVNGAARAIGRLGDAQGVHRLVGQAQDMLTGQEVPPGIVSSISFGCYSEAQVASNAATAYLSLGMPEKVRHHLDVALPDISASGSPWSRALVTIDLATAVAQSREADLDQACGLVLTALETARGRPVVSIQQRAAEFVEVAAQRWEHASELDVIRDALAHAGAGAAGV